MIIYEIYQILFFASIISIIYVISDLGIKMYSKFKLGVDTKFILTKSMKIILWIAFAIILSFLTKPNIL